VCDQETTKILVNEEEVNHVMNLSTFAAGHLNTQGH